MESWDLGASKLGRLKEKRLSSLQTLALKFGVLRIFFLLATLSLRLNYGRLREIILSIQTLAPKFGMQRVFCSQPSQACLRDQKGWKHLALSVPNFDAEVWNAGSQMLPAIGGTLIFWSSIYGQELEFFFKLHTRWKQEINMKESKKKTRNMKHETRIKARNKSWKDIKRKEKKKELEILPPSSLMLACLLPP